MTSASLPDRFLRSPASEAQNATALKYIVEVVDAGSFSQAARRLGVNASTLTRRVSKIEDQLGLTLFERTRSGIQITTAGRPVIQQIRRALREFAAIIETARANGLGSLGEIRIGTRMPITAGPLLDIFVAWREAHPGILLRVFELSDHELRTALVDRRLDAAFIVRHALWPGSAHIPVFREQITAALPAGHTLARIEAVSWEQLRHERLLTQGWNDSQTAREFFASLMGSGVEFLGHAASKQTIFGLVAAGFGVTLAVESQSQLGWPGIVFRPISEPDAIIDISLAWIAESEDAATGLFVAFVRDRAPLAMPSTFA